MADHMLTYSACEHRWHYRDFTITYDPPPIPPRNCDYQWVHNEYDGPPDSRYGHSGTLEQAKADIDDWYDEQEDG